MNSTRELLLQKALSAIDESRFKQAAAVLEDLIREDESDAESWSYLGVACIAENREKALHALQTAISKEPHHAQWHLNLGICLHQIGQYQKGEKACQMAFEKSGGAVEIIDPWTDTLLALGSYGRAAELLKKAISQKPTTDGYRKLTTALANTGDAAGAAQCLGVVMQSREPGKGDRLTMARLQMQLQNFAVARKEIESLHKEFANDSEVSLLMAQVHQVHGELALAEKVLTDAYRRSTDNVGIILALLDRTGVSEQIICSAKVLLEKDQTSMPERRALAYGLARCLEQLEEFDGAWRYVNLANDLYHDDVSYEENQSEHDFRIALQLVADTPGLEVTEDDPGLVYIVGPPRSGGTLLQTLLAAAPGVESVGERGALLPFLFNMPAKAGERIAQWNMEKGDLQKADIAGLRSLYPQARMFVDKTPHHSHVAGLVKQIHPGSIFIDCHRNPMDMALSIFFHDFPAAFSYSRKLEDIVSYLLFHRHLIEQWQAAGIEIIVHDHESFIRNPEDVAAALFDSMGLQWKNEYLDASHRTSSVQTFSVNQVRQDITAKFSRRWKNYDSFLGDIPDRLAKLL